MFPRKPESKCELLTYSNIVRRKLSRCKLSRRKLSRRKLSRRLTNARRVPSKRLSLPQQHHHQLWHLKELNLFDLSNTIPETVKREIDTKLSFCTTSLKSGLERYQDDLLPNQLLYRLYPLSFYPIYRSIKAGIHALTLILRQQLVFASEETKNNMSVVKILPSYVDTGLDAEYRAATIAIQGGP